MNEFKSGKYLSRAKNKKKRIFYLCIYKCYTTNLMHIVRTYILFCTHLCTQFSPAIRKFKI